MEEESTQSASSPIQIPRNNVPTNTAPPNTPSIAALLENVRAGLERVSPTTAHHLLHSSPSPPAVLVDIRPQAQREREGSIPGALIVERNVLEWRFDPQSPDKLAVEGAGRYDLRVMVMCSEGYTSSLAAGALRGLGLGNATGKFFWRFVVGSF